MKLPVMVVDDDESIGQVFEFGFRDEGVAVKYFSSARKALAWTKTRKPALAVIDVMMPDMDGVELCQELRSREGTRDLPIILISAIDQAKLRELAARFGAASVSKPFAPREVFELMRHQLASKRAS